MIRFHLHNAQNFLAASCLSGRRSHPCHSLLDYNPVISRATKLWRSPAWNRILFSARQIPTIELGFRRQPRVSVPRHGASTDITLHEPWSVPHRAWDASHGVADVRGSTLCKRQRNRAQNDGIHKQTIRPCRRSSGTAEYCVDG